MSVSSEGLKLMSNGKISSSFWEASWSPLLSHDALNTSQSLTTCKKSPFLSEDDLFPRILLTSSSEKSTRPPTTNKII